MKRDKASKFKFLMLGLFFFIGVLIFLTAKFASPQLQWINGIWIVCLLFLLLNLWLACPNCHHWFTLKEVARIGLARSKGGGFKGNRSEYFDWISPNATEEDKNYLYTLRGASEEELGGKKGQGIFWSKFERLTMKCSNCNYSFPSYKEKRTALSYKEEADFP